MTKPTQIFWTTERWVIHGAFVLFLYVVMRLLVWGMGDVAYILLSFMLSTLFFAFINVVYGYLPTPVPTVHNDSWKNRLLNGYFRGKRLFGVTTPPFTIKQRKRFFLCCYLLDINGYNRL